MTTTSAAAHEPRPGRVGRTPYHRGVPVYEYRCLECDDVFELRRAMEAADAVRCPAGHPGVKRLLSMFAGGRRGAPDAAAGGGCCGGSCGCG